MAGSGSGGGHALRLQHDHDPFKEPVQKERFPGTHRNDPCPCGSGKKYKRCCKDRPSSLVGPRVWRVLLALAAGLALAWALHVVA